MPKQAPIKAYTRRYTYKADETVEPPEVIIEQSAPPTTMGTEAEQGGQETATPAAATSDAATAAAQPSDASSPSTAAPGISPRAPATHGGTPNGQTVIVTPQATSLPAMAAEDRPPTREEVVADAVYANTHGLIPRGEVAVAHEDKGMLWAQQMAQSMDSQRMANAATGSPQRLAMR